jgi:hypothetical protein
MIQRWMRYPFAFAGPVSAALLSVSSLTGLVLVVAGAGPLSLLIGVGVLLVLGWAVNQARSRYGRRRGVDYEAREFWARVVPNLIAVAAVFTSAILVAYFSLHQGWIFVMAGPLWFRLELLLRLIAIAAGDKPDPRWAIDYRLEPVEAADGGVD